MDNKDIIYSNITVSSRDDKYDFLLSLEYPIDNSPVDVKFAEEDDIYLYFNSIYKYSDNSIQAIDNTDTFILTGDENKRCLFRLYSSKFRPSQIRYYYLNAYIFIGGRKINLLGSLIDTYDDFLASKEVRYKGHSYWEYVEFNIVNPNYLLYHDTGIFSLKQQYRASSMLYVEITPIELVDNQYIRSSVYFSNSTTFNNNDIELTFDVIYKENELVFNITNPLLERGDLEHLTEYINSLYLTDISRCVLSFETIIKDDENIYKYFKYDNIEYIPGEAFENNIVIDIPDDLKFDSWLEYKSGLSSISTCTVILYGQMDDVAASFVVYSNTTPITQNIFKYLIKSSLNFNEINLDDVDMNTYNVNVINKIQNNITQVKKSNDTKSHLIRPVFYKTFDLESITLRKNVKQNVLINLDQYKSLVDTFSLKIQDVYFPEIGRQGKGIIFSIDSSILGEDISGDFYVCSSETNEFITSGKYNII